MTKTLAKLIAKKQTLLRRQISSEARNLMCGNNTKIVIEGQQNSSSDCPFIIKGFNIDQLKNRVSQMYEEYCEKTGRCTGKKEDIQKKGISLDDVVNKINNKIVKNEWFKQEIDDEKQTQTPVAVNAIPKKE